MHIEAWDEVFIRCQRTSVNALLTHVPSWPLWWPGMSVGPGLTPGTHAVTLRSPWHPLRPQRLQLTVDRIRPRDKGLEYTVGADVVGTGEWFHLDEPNGVVVHHLIRGTLQRGNPRRWVAAHRSAVRAGMTALKRRLESGRPPGAEPHPRLLQLQAGELEVYAREVAAHHTQLATRRASDLASDQTPPTSLGGS